MKTLLITGGVVAALGAGIWWLSGSLGGDVATAVQGVTAQRGALRIGVVEAGNLKAANSYEIQNELEGTSTILYLIEEGSKVGPGDLLVELDATDLLDRKVSQEITVENSRGNFVKAEQNLAIQKSQNESDIASAKRKLEFALKDKQKYLEGDWPQQKQSAADEILLAEEELTRAEDKLRWSKDLESKGFLTRTELEADQLALQRAEIKLAQTRRALELLEQFDYPRQVRALEADVEEAQRELERVELQAAARLVDFEANVRSSESTYKLEKDKFERYEQQLEKARIYAPAEGLVVYATESDRRGGSSDPIAEGTQVRERQNIITIPSSNEMVVEVKLHESVVQQVDVDQRALVRVDALPGEEFEGRVRFKAVLPDQNSWWGNPNLRVYRAEVEVLEPSPEMRPGMSCSVEVVVAELEDAVYVPIQSVVVSGGTPLCFVRTATGAEPREVEVGLHNSTWVEIRAGLDGGEVVLLSAPEGFEVEYTLGDDQSGAGPGPEGGAAQEGARGGPPMARGASEGQPSGGRSPASAEGGWSGKAGGQWPAGASGSAPGGRPAGGGAPGGGRPGAESQ
jgi:HlyD family secretion protein